MTKNNSPAMNERARDLVLDIVTKTPLSRLLSNMRIGRKLRVGFYLLMALTLFVVVLSVLAGDQARMFINLTDKQLFPVATVASEAEADLLRMQASVHAYLVLGEAQYRTDYENARAIFEAGLNDLISRKEDMSDVNRGRLDEVHAVYTEWSALPDQMFDLRDDRLTREPAYATIAIDGVAFGGQVILQIHEMIELQTLRTPSQTNVELLADMSDFQYSFAQMMSGLRNYTTTRNRAFRREYEENLVLNELAWSELQEKRVRGLLNTSQEALMNIVDENRTAFLALPEEEIYHWLEQEPDISRQDLLIFRTEAVPKAELMLALLDDIHREEEVRVARFLEFGNMGLASTRVQTIAAGIGAVVLGLGLALSLGANIVGPITRLTAVAGRIEDGDLEAQALIESRDEIGLLATAFNSMTGRLRGTLQQVRKEKTRADNLLNVVIPIGVQLSSEKDFNKLLEKMLVEAKSFCHADAGSLYLAKDNELHFEIVHNDSQDLQLGGTTGNKVTLPHIPLYLEDGSPNKRNVATYSILTGEVVNVADAYHSDVFDFPGIHEFDDNLGYHTVSLLTIPLKDEDDIHGVLQLINARATDGEIIPFDDNLQQMMESFSSLATAALTAYIREQALRQEIRQLRIEINEAKVQQQVSETVDTDFFQQLQSKSRDIRRRRSRRRQKEAKDDTQ